MKLVCFLGAMVLAAQPAAAIHTVQMAPAANAVVPNNCAQDARRCSPQAAAAPAESATVLANGPLVAGIVGLLVLGLVFGRRKAGLPEVVS